MSCLFPSTIRISRHGGAEYIQVPCRKCINCRIQKQSDLEFACMLASQQAYRKGLGCSFVTLTYSNETVPLSLNKNVYYSLKPDLNMTLRKIDFQKFNKRLRDYCRRNFAIDYQFVACGEYGDDSQFTQRPHYHSLFFGLDSYTADSLIRKSWKYGIVDIGTLSQGGIRYVIDYIMKQNEKEYAKLYDEINIERPFLIHSQKLGNDYFFNEFPYTQDFRYMKKGKPAIIPATYRRKIDSFRQFDYFDSDGHIEASKLRLSYPNWQALQAVCKAEDYILRSRQRGRACYALEPKLLDYIHSCMPYSSFVESSHDSFFRSYPKDYPLWSESRKSQYWLNYHLAHKF